MHGLFLDTALDKKKLFKKKYTCELGDFILDPGKKALNPLHPCISIHILLTVRYTFPEVLIRKSC